MATKYISELQQTTNIADNDLFVIDDGSRNYAIKWGTLKGKLTTVGSFTVNNTAGTISIVLSNGDTLTVTPHDPTKQDTLTFDGTPTASSTNPVTSGGVKSALDDKLNISDYTIFTGATDQSAGVAGKVPAPAIGGNRYLSSSGAWTAPDSTPTDASTNLITSDAVFDALQALAIQLAAEYDATATYAVGAYCVRDNALYRCSTAISTAEAWTAGHWTACTVADELGTMSETISSMQCLKVSRTGISSLQARIPAGTDTNAAITADMYCIKAELSNPSAQLSDWTVNTYAGYLTIDGTISGTTDVALYLLHGH